MPAILVLAVLITVIIAVSANRRAAQKVQSSASTEEASTYEIPEAAMEENAYPEVNELIEVRQASSHPPHSIHIAVKLVYLKTSLSDSIIYGS